MVINKRRLNGGRIVGEMSVKSLILLRPRRGQNFLIDPTYLIFLVSP
jgi:hypothetical protein